MIRRALAAFILTISLIGTAAAQESVTVGTTRDVNNGALFLAAARGYFKAEGLTLSMRAYPNAQNVAEALAGGATDLGLAAFSAAAFDLAGRGAIKAIAAQVSEKREREGNAIVASIPAFNHGLHKFANLAGKVAAISEFGSVYHYQFGRIAEHERFSLGSMALKPLRTADAMAQAVASGKVDAAILPLLYARDMLLAGQARMIGVYSSIDEQQLGALFASAKTLQNRRAMLEKFVRAYRRGVADYTAAFLHYEHYKRALNEKSPEAGAAIAGYVFPGRSGKKAGLVVANASYYMDAQARLNTADIARQIAWYKAQGLIGKDADAANAVDLSFVK